MDLLVIGGTSFLGRAYVDAALDRGDRVTTFNRGVTAPDNPSVEAVHGDRTQPADLEQLRGRTWDAVVDTSGFVPRVVGASAALLAGATRGYAYVSSLSASAQWPAEPADESGATQECPPDAGPDDGDYGELKAGSERAVTAAYGDRALLLRPGIILGPWENVGRLPAWLDRIAAGGRVLAPGDPDLPIQLIDARDIAVWTLDALDRGVTGLFNMVGPPGNATFGSWLGDCVEVTGSDAELVWADDAFLTAHVVEPWTELPLWMPMNGEGDYGWQASAARAEAEGLRCRPVRETVEDTWAWMQGGGTVPQRPGRPRHGMDRARETALLEAWDSRLRTQESPG